MFWYHMTFKTVSQNFKDLIHHIWTADIDSSTNVKRGMPIHTGLTIFQGRQISATAW